MLRDMPLKGFGSFEGGYIAPDCAGGVLRAEYMIVVDSDAAVSWQRDAGDNHDRSIHY